MKLTEEQAQLLPTTEDLAFYRENGYYVSPVLFSEAEIEDALYGSERFYAGERDSIVSPELERFLGSSSRESGIRTNDYVSLVNREIAAVAQHPLIGAIAATLSRHREILLWHDQMIFKPPSQSLDTAIGWHTDRAYWRTCSSEDLLTAWIPLHDCDETIGTLMVVPGSHRRNDTADLRGFHNKRLADSAPEDWRSFAAPLNLRRGQVSFHHCRTIHGSDSNRARQPRVTISVHLQDDSNRYVETRDEAGQVILHRNDFLCRRSNGVPDYRDPSICPVLWA
jgi:hypothetical protein